MGPSVLDMARDQRDGGELELRGIAIEQIHASIYR